jgi:hypothetical protein
MHKTTLKECHALKMFEKAVRKRMLEPEREKWRRIL